MNNWLKNTGTALFIGLGVFFFALMLRITYPYFSFEYDVDFLLTKQKVLHVLIWRISFYTHISSSLIVLLIGVVQFPRFVVKIQPKIHRAAGKAYVLLVLVLSAPSGFVMALFANGGLAAQTSFAIVSVLWWYYTWQAYLAVRKGNFDLHLAQVYRSYALTLSAISLRTYVLLLPHIVHMKGKDMYVLVAWASWVPNLLVAEWLIRRLKRTGNGLNA